MGVAGAISAARITLLPSTQMADAADRRCNAVSAARLLALADAAAGLSAGNHCAALLLRLARPRHLAEDQPLEIALHRRHRRKPGRQPPGEPAHGNNGADIIFGTVGAERDFRSLVTAQQVGLEFVQSSQLPIEHDIAGLFGEDSDEAHAQAPGHPEIGVAPIGFQVGIESPDQAALDIDGEATRVAQWLQLVDAPFGMHPARGMGLPIEVAEDVLGHTSSTRQGVAGVYNKYIYLDEKRVALGLWGQYLSELRSTKLATDPHQKWLYADRLKCMNKIVA